MTEAKGFVSLRVAAFESRMAKEMESLIRRYGGEPSVAPALREIPLEDNSTALRFGARLLTEQVDILILLTGVGTKALFDILQTRHALSDIIAALKHTVLVARGPKPAAALKSLGLSPTLTVPEPNTWHDLIATLDTYRPAKGLRVAVQEYGVSNQELLNALQERGAQVTAVPVYRWALPEDTGPLARVIDSILAGSIHVMLITNAAQIDHVMQLVERAGAGRRFKDACARMMVGSIGPTASERLREYDLPVDLEPTHPKMGILVKEASEQAAAILQRKSS
ncbi:MAG TPA: uroporphyrinogen-III synthase [Nitrospiraceae bacterium]|nr:uroporphyrinogen-III synthase [Nitrospiraceae bacterium]